MLAFISRSLHTVSSSHDRQSLDASIAFFTIPSGPVAYRLFRRRNVPYLVSLRGGDVPGHVPGHRALHLVTRPFRRAILRSAASIVANSESLAATSRSADPFSVRVIPNGVDCELYHPTDAANQRRDPSAPLRLLYVGRIHPEKNLGLVVSQLAKLRSAGRTEIQLVVVGDGAQRDELGALAQRMGVSGQIRWLGWQAKARLPSLYREADALINPSQYEGMPNAVLEAMATGIPVIASDVGGNRSVVVPGVTGFLFPLEKPDTMGAHICRLADEPDIVASLGAKGRKRAELDYSWTATAQSYLELLAPTPAGFAKP